MGSLETTTTTPAAAYRPDMAALACACAAVPPAPPDHARQLLRDPAGGLDDEGLAGLVKSVLSAEHARAVTPIVLEAGQKVRTALFGREVISMAPVEVSNTCASDCVFCGWRSSNRAMKRLKLPADLAMEQVSYLIDLGISHIEFVSGDDVGIVRDVMPGLISDTKRLFAERGINGKVSFCTLALTESQYGDLRAAGADTMIVWQESYDPGTFRTHVVGGPKAHGIGDDWRTIKDGDGCAFRIESQDRAMRAGLEVALGSMLGLNPDVPSEFLATVHHVRHLERLYGASAERPIIIGMPIWNPITTRETDRRPGGLPSMSNVFPALAALYLLALPRRSTWVFPNCRVPMAAQISAIKSGGVFTSTEVKLGPGGYLPSVIRADDDKSEVLRRRVLQLLRKAEGDVSEIAAALDEREQFVHHYHEHEIYRREIEKAGLELTSSAFLSAA